MQKTKRFFLLGALFLLMALVSSGLAVVGNPARVLFDETRLSLWRFPEGGTGFLLSVEETRAYGASQFTELLREQGYIVEKLPRSGHITAEVLKNADVLVILMPGRADLAAAGMASVRGYAKYEREAITRFVEQGGSLFLAALPYHSLKIDRAFGVRFKNTGIICAPGARGGGDFETVIISTLSEHSVTRGITSYYFWGTYLEVLGTSEPLAKSDSRSWFDNWSIIPGTRCWFLDIPYQSGDQEKGPRETSGPFPVLAFMEYGAGRIVFAGDAYGILSNRMIDELDGKQLALNIIE